MRKLSFLLVLLLLTAMQVLAQRTITGKVISTDDGSGIPGVTVLVKGTSTGVLTDLDGKYSISVPKDATALQFSFIGMKTQEIALTASNVIEVSMESSATNIEGVVVTALGITRDKKSLGYSTQAVDGSEINNVKRDNFVNSLSGRVSGVQVKSSGNMGGSSNVVIRGSRSLTGNNQALFVVDGVPVDNSNVNNSGQITGRNGYDYGNAASDINPNDIESMSVLKGAAATSLYGSRAANGVILITTKKGTKRTGENKAIGVTINSSVTTGIVDKSTFPKYQQEYGAGYSRTGYGAGAPIDGFELVYDVNGDGLIDPTVPTYEDASYGQKFDPSISLYQYDSYYPISPNFNKKTPWAAPGDKGPISFFENSMNISNSIDISGGGDNSTFRLGYTNLDQSGIMPNGKLKKNSIILNGSYDVLKNLTVSASASYANTSGKGRNSTGYNENVLTSFRQWMQTNTDYTMQKTLYDLSGENISWNPKSFDNLAPAYWDNPYFLRGENFEKDNRNRIIGYMQTDYKLTDYLSFMGRTSIDTYSELNEERRAVGSVAGEWGVGRLDAGSGYSRFAKTFTETNMDLMAKFNKNLTQDLTLSAIVGTNIRKTTIDQTYASTSGGLIVPGLYSLGNSLDELPKPEEVATQAGVNGVYANVSLGFMNMLYLEGSIRRDQSSTLPLDKNYYYYPSVSGSFVFSNLIEKAGASWLQLGKIRFGYAEVGNSAPWGSLVDTYSQFPTFGSTPLYSVPSTKNNPELLPEKTKALEAGLEMTFLQSRLGFDVSVYDNRTVNQILPVTVSAATGYTGKYINAGEVQNKGIEVSMFVTPLKTNDFKWDINVNFSKNQNKVLSLTEGITNLPIASLQGGISINARVGQPYGTMQGTDFVIDSASGQRVIRTNGQYQKSATSDKIIGQISPDWNGGISNKFTYKGISLSFLIDIQHGGSIFSLDQWYGQATGLYTNTVGNNELGNPLRDPVVFNQYDAKGKGILAGGYTPTSGGILHEGVTIAIDPATNKPFVDPVTLQPTGQLAQNTRRIAGDAYTAFGYAYNPNSIFVYDASYVKLREIVLSYSLPKSLIGKTAFHGVTFSLVGSNLWILSKNLPDADPESGQSSGNVQGWQSGVMPSTKNIGFSVNLQF